MKVKVLFLLLDLQERMPHDSSNALKPHHDCTADSGSLPTPALPSDSSVPLSAFQDFHNVDLP